MNPHQYVQFAQVAKNLENENRSYLGAAALALLLPHQEAPIQRLAPAELTDKQLAVLRQLFDLSKRWFWLREDWLRCLKCLEEFGILAATDEMNKPDYVTGAKAREYGPAEIGRLNSPEAGSLLAGLARKGGQTIKGAAMVVLYYMDGPQARAAFTHLRKNYAEHVYFELPYE